MYIIEGWSVDVLIEGLLQYRGAVPPLRELHYTVHKGVQLHDITKVVNGL